MKKLAKEFKKLRNYIPKNSTIYLEIDLIRLKDFFLNKNKNKVLEFILKEFKKIIGKKGNLIVPGFTYSWGKDSKKKIFDIKKTLPKTGIFPIFLISKTNVQRTKDPMFSFLILGKDRNKLKKIGRNSFGYNSLFEKINNNKTYLVSFGLNKFDPTFVHYVEEYFDSNIKKLKYRFSKKYNGYYQSGKKKEKDFFYSFSRDLKLNKYYSEKKIRKALIKKRQLKIINFYSFKVFISTAKNFFDAGIKGMKKDINFFVKN